MKWIKMKILLILILFKLCKSTRIIIDGNFTIGVLFNVHNSYGNFDGTSHCGKINELEGLRRVELALFMISHINNYSSILPGITLGLDIRDTCQSIKLALKETIGFLEDYGLFQMKSNKLDARKKFNNTLIGVVGPTSSSETITVQNLLQLYSIPQIGYSATSIELDDAIRFPTFRRLIPSDIYQVEVIIEIIKLLSWNYVSLVYSEGSYGRSLMLKFSTEIEKHSICIAKSIEVPKYASESFFEKAVNDLQNITNARLVVCFCEKNTSVELTRAVYRMNLTEKIYFIASDHWDLNEIESNELGRGAEGSIILHHNTVFIDSLYEFGWFGNYYEYINIAENTRNPWMKEYYDEGPVKKLPINANRTCITHYKCMLAEKILTYYARDSRSKYLKYAIWLQATALHDMISDVCGHNYYGICDKMKYFNYTLFQEHIDEQIAYFKTNISNAYKQANYEIFYLDKKYRNYELVAEWKDGFVKIHDKSFINEITANLNLLNNNRCSKTCGLGYYKKFDEDIKGTCCWTCVPCELDKYINNVSSCIPCPYTYRPNRTRNGCEKIPINHSSFKDLTSIMVAMLSMIGLAMAIITIIIFIKFNETPVVKSSSRELSYIILTGIILAHLSVFPLIAPPSIIICNLARLLPGISFGMIYASLLIRTIRISRLLAKTKSKFPKQQHRFMSPTALLSFCGMFICLEIVITSSMVICIPSEVTNNISPNFTENILTCNDSPLVMLSPFVLDLILLSMCTVYAVKTRNIPENFNEAKFIGFSIYTTSVIWIAFIVIYFSKSISDVLILSICTTLSASVVLVFLFFPKMFILLFRPERNSRVHFVTNDKIRLHIGTQSSNNENPSTVPFPKRSKSISIQTEEYNFYGRLHAD